MKRLMAVLVAAIGCWQCSSVVALSGLQPPAGVLARSKVIPIDEAEKDEGLLEFRNRLISAVKVRNAEFVLEAAVDELRGQLRALALPKTAFAGPSYEAADWPELEELLRLGGSFTTTRGRVFGRREFCAPYVYSAYPQRDVIAFLLEKLAGRDENPTSLPSVILGSKVPARRRPEQDARIVEHLSHDLLLVREERGTPPDWYSVYLSDTVFAWVRAGQIRSPLDYHACFATIDGRWRLTEFEKDKMPE